MHAACQRQKEGGEGRKWRIFRLFIKKGKSVAGQLLPGRDGESKVPLLSADFGFFRRKVPPRPVAALRVNDMLTLGNVGSVFNRVHLAASVAI